MTAGRRPRSSGAPLPRFGGGIGWGLPGYTLAIMPRRRRLFAAALLVLVALAALVAALGWRLHKTVRQALDHPAAELRPLARLPLTPPSLRLAHWSGADVESVAATPEGLLIAGGFGLARNETLLDVDSGLPTLAASALTLWRGTPVLGLTAGGLFALEGGQWQELRPGWGTLQVRALHETAAGELLVGARQGLFRVAWGAAEMERLDTHPVRTIATAGARLFAGGEEGLYQIEPTRARRVETPEAWIESAVVVDGELVVASAAGLARGPFAGPLAPVTGGEALVQGAVHEGRFVGVREPRAAAVVHLDPTGRLTEELVPALARRVLSTGGALFVDTDAGLYVRERSGWTLARPRGPSALPPGGAHITALASHGGRLFAGIFDGGLVVGETRPTTGLVWRPLRGATAWAVNALLQAGGALYVASLRGAARLDAGGLAPLPLEGPGAAFALATTPDGLVIGYGQGVLLPQRRLLSAFHGLPGNQATALASAPPWLFVGTPSGLGALRDGRVAWRVSTGEGRLPHPWVNALALDGVDLVIGTYGGGLVRRRAPRSASARLDDPGAFEPFVETEGLKINAGCLVAAYGRLYAGTDGHGLWRSTADGRRFERLRLALPSQRITALALVEGELMVGTDEGLARLPPIGATEPLEEASALGVILKNTEGMTYAARDR